MNKLNMKMSLNGKSSIPKFILCFQNFIKNNNNLIKPKTIFIKCSKLFKACSYLQIYFDSIIFN